MDGAAAVVVGPAAEDGGEGPVGALHLQVGAEQQETERRLAENGLRRGEVRLDAAQGADVDDDADGGALAGLRLGRHHIDLGYPLRIRSGAVLTGDVLTGDARIALTGGRSVRLRRPVPGHPEGDDAGPLTAVEDLRHLAVAALAQFRGDEGLDGVLAHGFLRTDAEELRRAAGSTGRSARRGRWRRRRP